jgi:hypothetical protein
MDFIREEIVAEKKSKKKLFPTTKVVPPVGRKPSPEDVEIFAAMDSDATIDSDGNEKEDSQGKKRRKRRKKARGRLGTHRTSTAAGEERSLSHPCCTLPAPLKKTS